MPKRPREESREERWKRKMKNYESKLKKNRLGTFSGKEEYSIDETGEPEAGGEWYVMDCGQTSATQASYESPVAETDEPAAGACEPTVDNSESAAAPSAGAFAAPVVPAEQIVRAEVSSETDFAAADVTVTYDVDPTLLDALGSFEDESTDWGEPMVDEIAMRLKSILSNGSKKVDKEMFIDKYPFPKNLTLAKAPTLNAEISAMLTESSRNRDKRVCDKQNQLGAVLSGMTKAMSLLLSKEPKIIDVVTILSDTSKLLADSHYLETDTRRSLITPLIDKDLLNPFKGHKRDEFLFGDNLGDLVKNSRGIKKTGQLIQAPANLNSRGPSSRGRLQKIYITRGGGQQKPYRRRPVQYAPPPPAPGRRQQHAPPAARHLTTRKESGDEHLLTAAGAISPQSRQVHAGRYTHYTIILPWLRALYAASVH